MTAGRNRFVPHLAGLALVVVAAGLYLPVWDHAFVEFDDPLYVTSNAQVREGLSLDNLRWAFTNDDAFLWHPLTWCSLLLDATLHGTERAGPWLATNVALHALGVGLALWALLALTARWQGPGRRWACWLAAAAYALHPLQVEAVAWVSGRKELLAAALFWATLVAWSRYVQRPSRGRYAAVLLWSALGAMAKGSHAALPFLLLLFDVWPLGRIAGRFDPGRLWSLVREKLPLLAIQVASVAINFAFASRAGNVWGHDPPLVTRLSAVIVNGIDVLARVAWPSALTISYPNPLQPVVAAPTALEVLLALATLAGVTAMAWLRAPARRPLLVGWLGFWLMWLPMSGIVPMGLRTPHDRYLVVPLGVLALGLAFGLRAIAGDSRLRRRAIAILACGLLFALALQTHRQIPVWRDDDALFQHALRLVPNDAVAHHGYGTALGRRGDTEGARKHFEHALALHPDFADAHHNLGWTLMFQGEPERGIGHLERAVALRPDWDLALLHLGEARFDRGDLAGAVASFESAVRVAPDSVTARTRYGVALMLSGRNEEAERALRAALDLDPEQEQARAALAWLQKTRAESEPDR